MGLMTKPPQTITHDELLELLSHPRRRQIVRHVATTDGPIPEDELVDSLAGPSEAVRREWAITAHHQHLPKLEASGVLDRGPCGGTVEAGPRLANAVSFLQWIETLDGGDAHEGI